MTVYTPSVRDPFTQQVSVKIGITLDRFYADLVNETGIPINTHYREALSRFALDPCSHEDYLKKQEQAKANEKRIQELEEEVRQLRLILTPGNLPLALPNYEREVYRAPLVPALLMPEEPIETLEEIQAAFSDNRVMDTFVKLAQLIENEEIDPEQEVIVNHFTTLCPHIKVKRVLDAISEVGYRVEHRQVEPKAARLLAIYLSFHPEANDATGTA